jgi:hypothetical protein
LRVLREASHLSKENSFAKKSQQRIAGQTNGCRQRRVKRNKENKIIIRTWNVRNRWEDDIRNDIKKLKIKSWTNCNQERKNWKLYVEKAKTFKELKL